MLPPPRVALHHLRQITDGFCPHPTSKLTEIDGLTEAEEPRLWSTELLRIVSEAILIPRRQVGPAAVHPPTEHLPLVLGELRDRPLRLERRRTVGSGATQHEDQAQSVCHVWSGSFGGFRTTTRKDASGSGSSCREARAVGRHHTHS